MLRRRTDATEMIEEAMVLANNQVASYLSERGFPSVYRVHEPPSPESLAELVPVLQEFDYLKTVSASAFSAGSPTAIQAVLGRAAGRPRGRTRLDARAQIDEAGRVQKRMWAPLRARE